MCFPFFHFLSYLSLKSFIHENRPKINPYYIRIFATILWNTEMCLHSACGSLLCYQQYYRYRLNAKLLHSLVRKSQKTLYRTLFVTIALRMQKQIQIIFFFWEKFKFRNRINLRRFSDNSVNKIAFCSPNKLSTKNITIGIQPIPGCIRVATRVVHFDTSDFGIRAMKNLGQNSFKKLKIRWIDDELRILRTSNS